MKFHKVEVISFLQSFVFLCYVNKVEVISFLQLFLSFKRSKELESLRPLTAVCRDTKACQIQILTRFTQPHRLCSWSQSEIYQNLDSNSAATLGPRAQVNYAKKNEITSTLLTKLIKWKGNYLRKLSLVFSNIL